MGRLTPTFLRKFLKLPDFRQKTGAGEEIRTLDINLGKVALYP